MLSPAGRDPAGGGASAEGRAGLPTAALREGGQEVALKVQRPDMIRAVSLDLHILRSYMCFVEWFKKQVLTGVLGAADRDAFDVRLLDTFARASYLELDYRHEAPQPRAI